MAQSMYDLAIIGGGIIGLASAMEILKQHPSLRLVVLEKEHAIAHHQTGHNSGVIHSGIYYTPGSVKAQTCVRGKKLLIDFCETHQISYTLCGKVIVATHQDEIAGLDQLYQRGLANGVPHLEMIGPERLREIEPHVVGIKALYSPTTGIVDFAQVTRAFADEILSRGATILTNHKVTGIHKRNTHYRVTTSCDVLEARFIISAAGLYADRIAHMTGAAVAPKIIPFRGDYYMLSTEQTCMVKSLIYPVPDPKFPFLGVHFTRRPDGAVWLGPNAVLALAREGYHRLSIQPRDAWETLRYRGFQKLALTYWKMGLDEMYRDFSKSAFLKSLQRYMPALRMSDLLPGPAGVRAQALDASGNLIDDFIIDQQENMLHVRNAPSPAATSSLAIAEFIARTANSTFSW